MTTHVLSQIISMGVGTLNIHVESLLCFSRLTFGKVFLTLWALVRFHTCVHVHITLILFIFIIKVPVVCRPWSCITKQNSSPQLLLVTAFDVHWGGVDDSGWCGVWEVHKVSEGCGVDLPISTSPIINCNELYCSQSVCGGSCSSWSHLPSPVCPCTDTPQPVKYGSSS